MYAASACLVLVLIIMGVSMINSFDRMKSVQNTLVYACRSGGQSGDPGDKRHSDRGDRGTGRGRTSRRRTDIRDLDADNSEDADSGQEDLTSGDNAGTSANTLGMTVVQAHLLMYLRLPVRQAADQMGAARSLQPRERMEVTECISWRRETPSRSSAAKCTGM